MKKLHSVEFVSPSSDRTDLGFLLSSERNQDERKALTKKTIDSQLVNKAPNIDVSAHTTLNRFKVQFEKSMLSPSEKSYPEGLKFQENDANSGEQSYNDISPATTPGR
jgi:hypothetical protein